MIFYSIAYEIVKLDSQKCCISLLVFRLFSHANISSLKLAIVRFPKAKSRSKRDMSSEFWETSFCLMATNDFLAASLLLMRN